MTVSRAVQAEGSNFREIHILMLFDADQAVSQCKFHFDVPSMEDFLLRTGLTLDDVYTKPRSEELQQDIDSTAELYSSNLAKACRSAWADYGPEGALGTLLAR